MTLRVALDLQAARQQRTGIGQYARELARALAQEDGIEVLPVDWGRDPVMRIPVRLAWQQWGLPRRARATGANLLHATGFDAPLWQPLPLVYTVHDLIGMLYPDNLPPVARFYWSKWLPWSVRFARYIIADSECTKRDLQRLLAVPLERITVVPLAADGRFVPQPPDVSTALRARLQLPERMVLYVGTVEPRKGLDTLLDAWALLAAELPETQLVIAGKLGWYTDRLHDQLRRLGLTERVHWTGYVADEDLPALYGAADVFVFPSRYEGFGLPPLEAMACGTPVVASNAAALPEVVGTAGLLHAPDDAVALARLLWLVLSQPALHTELRARGLRQAHGFSWQRTARQTLAVYHAALAPSTIGSTVLSP